MATPSAAGAAGRADNTNPRAEAHKPPGSLVPSLPPTPRILAFVGACCALTAALPGAFGTAAGAAQSPTAQSAATGSYVLSGGPFAGRPLYVDPQSTAALAAATMGGDDAALNQLAQTPQAIWLTGGTPAEAGTTVQDAVSAAAPTGAVTEFVVYDIPDRDCTGGASAGGATSAGDYESYVTGIAQALTGAHAIVILEPDALADLDCLSFTDQTSRLSMLAEATETLAVPGVAVYLDAGHTGWQPADTMATRLTQAGIVDAAGFSLDVSNYDPATAETNYGDAVAAALLDDNVPNKQFVVDSSRDGTDLGSPDWCNADGATVGPAPGSTSGDPNATLLWIKHPGESDGACGDSDLGAGQFDVTLAHELVPNTASDALPSVSATAPGTIAVGFPATLTLTGPAATALDVWQTDTVTGAITRVATNVQPGAGSVPLTPTHTSIYSIDASLAGGLGYREVATTDVTVVNAPAQAVLTASVAGPAPTTITAQLRDSTGTAGADRTLTVQSRPATSGTYTTAGTVKTSAAGVATFRVDPTVGSYYRFVFAGDNTMGGATSAAVHVAARTLASVRAGAAGKVLTVRGTVTDRAGHGEPATSVAIMARTLASKPWATLATVTTTGNGTFSFTGRSPTALTHYRVQALASAQRQASSSAQVTVKAPTRLALAVKRGKPDRLTATLRLAANQAGLRGARLVIYYHFAGRPAWLKQRAVTTGSGGRVGVTEAPKRSTYYQVRFAGSAQDQATTGPSVHVAH